MSGDRIDLLAEIHKLEKENKKLNKALDRAVAFIDEYLGRFGCPYEIDDEGLTVDWPKCFKCGKLNGQQIECWKEYFKRLNNE